MYKTVIIFFIPSNPFINFKLCNLKWRNFKITYKLICSFVCYIISRSNYHFGCIVISCYWRLTRFMRPETIRILSVPIISSRFICPFCSISLKWHEVHKFTLRPVLTQPLSPNRNIFISVFKISRIINKDITQTKCFINNLNIIHNSISSSGRR